MFPGIANKGCFFHFTQAIWRTAQLTKLQIPHKEDDNVKQRRAAIPPPPPVPLDSTEDVWFRALKNNVADPTDTTKIFTDYVTEQWVNGDRLLWNHLDIGGPRTNNSLKEWQGRLKRWHNTLTPKSSHS